MMARPTLNGMRGWRKRVLETPLTSAHLHPKSSKMLSAPVGVPFACMNFMNPNAHLTRSAMHFFSASITIVHMTAVPGLSTCPWAWTDWGKLCPVQQKVLGWLMENSAIIVCVLQCVHSCARKGSPILWSLSCLGTNVPKIWLRMPWRARNNNTKWMTSCKILLPKKIACPTHPAVLVPLAMPHIRGQSRLQPLLSRRPQVQSTWKLRRPRLARCRFLATTRFLTFWTSPLDSVRYFQMQPWKDLSHSTVISTVIIMEQPIQQYPHSHTCKSSKLCTGLPACRSWPPWTHWMGA